MLTALGRYRCPLPPPCHTELRGGGIWGTFPPAAASSLPKTSWCLLQGKASTPGSWQQKCLVTLLPAASSPVTRARSRAQPRGAVRSPHLPQPCRTPKKDAPGGHAGPFTPTELPTEQGGCSIIEADLMHGLTGSRMGLVPGTRPGSAPAAPARASSFVLIKAQRRLPAEGGRP